jgi:uncharacterized delta-60 repeat protein
MKTISISVFNTLMVLCGLILGAADVRADVTEAWVNRYSNTISNSVDLAPRMVQDSAGDIIVTGTSNDNTSGPDLLTLKYSGTDGSFLWQQRHRYQGSRNENDLVSAAALDGRDDVIVTGGVNGPDAFSDFYTAKYSTADGDLLWEKRYAGPLNSDDYATAVAVDTQGSAIVTGISSGDFFTTKYAGTDGSILWERRGPPGVACHVAVDASGNVTVIGYSPVGNNGKFDLYIVKYAAMDGTMLWENRTTNAIPRADACALALDADGNVAVTALLWGTNQTGSEVYTATYGAATGARLWEQRTSGFAGGSVVTDLDGNVVVVDGGNIIKYASAKGEILWKQPIYLTYLSTPVLTLDRNGNLAVTGSLSGGWYSRDYKIAKYAAIDGALVWEQTYNGPEDGDDAPTAVALAANGDVIVTGMSVNGGRDADFHTARYSAEKGQLLWETRYNGPAKWSAEPRAVAVDSHGNVLVTGLAWNDSHPGVGYYTAKYAAIDGSLLWKKSGLGGGEQLVVDGNDNVIVTGYSYDSGEMYLDFYTVKYSSAGQLLWEKRYNGPANNNDFAKAVAVDADGNVIVTGVSNSTQGESSRDFYSAKYAAADGALVWERRYNGPADGNDQPQALAVDRNGDVVVAGRSAASGSRLCDYYTAKYAAADGALLWENRYNGPANSNDEATAVAVDESGNVLVSGLSAHSGSLASGFQYDSYTAKFASTSGALIWEKRIVGTTEQPAAPLAMAVDNKGDVVLAGSPAAVKLAGADGAVLWENSFLQGHAEAVALDASGNVVVFGIISVGSGVSFITTRYSANGTPLWEKRYGGAEEGSLNWANTSRCMALGRNGTIAITGSSYLANNVACDYLTILYRETLPPISVDRIQAGIRLRFTGAVGSSYYIERANNISGPWNWIATLTTPTDLVIEYIDANPPASTGYYRTRRHEREYTRSQFSKSVFLDAK